MTFPHIVAPADPALQRVLVAGVLPDAVATALTAWAVAEQLAISTIPDGAFSRVSLYGAVRPAMIVLGDAGRDGNDREMLIALKADARLQTIPVVAVVSRAEVACWLSAGADEAISSELSTCEVRARLNAALRRSRRDIQVNPSTGLVGSDAITAAIAQRMSSAVQFAACYADLDHFKEFNDRYGYAMGDDVIRTVAGLLVETVEATAGADGFVGHIGGDDFLFLVPLTTVVETCETLVRRADEILTQRYSAHDRQAGYFFGKDRRGRLDRVPLMTLSIGVVTNERRRFTHAAQVSELATEMKTYAKTLPGSVWAMDRRADGETSNPPEEKHQ
jgi:diguanylate cyclase (GGDEF)-like protein